MTPFWRIPVFEGSLFDVSWYLPMIGAVMSGYEYGGYLHWFEHIIRVFHLILPGANAQEVWFITRWISTTVMIWVGAWCFRKWIGLEVWTARIFSFAFWISLILVLGARPGVYSWYLPVCFAGLVGVVMAQRSLEQSKVKHAILWSLFAIATNWIYFWFFTFAVIWLASIWAMWILKRSRNAFLGLFTAGAVIAPIVAVCIAKWLPTSGLLPRLEVYERLGFAFTRMPFISNSMFVMFCWIALLIALPLLYRLPAVHVKRVVEMQLAWIALVLTWFLSSFMGIFFQNDHFRTPVVLLSFVSIALVWSAMKDREASTKAKWPLSLAIIPTLLAVIFLYRIIIPGYYIYHDEQLNVLHVTHWFTVAVAGAWMLWYRFKDRPFAAKHALMVVVVLSALTGITAAIHVQKGELKKIPGKLPQLPLVDWIRTNVPKDSVVCTDPVTAAFLGIHTERLTHPLAMTRYLQLTNEADLNILLQIASAYDVLAAGEGKGFRRFVRQDRHNACVQFAKQVKVMQSFGMSEERIEQILGCPREMINAELAQLEKVMLEKKLNPEEFQKVCPYVVVTDEKKAFWQIPSTYGSTSFPDGSAMWSASLTK
jgi:hypothetical protein